MPTVFRLTHEGPTADINVDIFRLTMPQEVTIEQRDDGLYAVVASTEEDASTQRLIDRELDRLFFLTCVRLYAEMCRRRVTASITCDYRINRSIPEGTAPLNWTDELELQFKLWSIAADTTNPMLRVLVLFQIIELSYPDTNDTIAYPPYADESAPPPARTEAKLLRHLVAHAGNAKPGTEKYLRFLGLPARLSNLTHRDWIRKLSDRLPIIEMQARELLQGAV